MTTRMLEAGLQQVLAPNPSPMTLHGTNTYLIGQSEIAVIDPGPAIPAHFGTKKFSRISWKWVPVNLRFLLIISLCFMTKVRLMGP